MSLINMDGALVQGYVSLGLALPTAYEGEIFKPPTDGSAWASVAIVPASSQPDTLGVNGEDLHTGFMQIDFYTKTGAGRAALIGYAQAVRDGFTAGQGFTKSGQNVLITSVERSNIIRVDGWLRVSLTVNFQARTIRPEI